MQVGTHCSILLLRQWERQCHWILRGLSLVVKAFIVCLLCEAMCDAEPDRTFCLLISNSDLPLMSLVCLPSCNCGFCYTILQWNFHWLGQLSTSIMEDVTGCRFSDMWTTSWGSDVNLVCCKREENIGCLWLQYFSDLSIYQFICIYWFIQGPNNQ